MAESRHDPVIGLLRYCLELVTPLKTEPTHFIHNLQPHPDERSVSFEALVDRYNGDIVELDLVEYLLTIMLDVNQDTRHRTDSRMFANSVIIKSDPGQS